MKKKLAWCGFILISYLFFLVLYLPLAWLWPQLPLPRQVKAEGLNGTLWQGRIEQLTIEEFQLQALRWQWQPASLLQGRLQVAVQLGNAQDQPRGKALVGLAADGGYLEDLKLATSAEWASSQLQLPIPARLTGNMVLNIDRYQHGGPWCHTLSGTLSWLDAAMVSILGEVMLEQVDARLGCTNGSLTARIEHVSNALAFSGDASLGKQARYRLEGTLKAGTELPAALAEQMHLLGHPDTQGRYRLNYDGLW